MRIARSVLPSAIILILSSLSCAEDKLSSLSSSEEFDPVVYAERVDKAIRNGEKKQVGKFLAGISNNQRQEVRKPIY